MPSPQLLFSGGLKFSEAVSSPLFSSGKQMRQSPPLAALVTPTDFLRAFARISDNLEARRISGFRARRDHCRLPQCRNVRNLPAFFILFYTLLLRQLLISSIATALTSPVPMTFSVSLLASMSPSPPTLMARKSSAPIPQFPRTTTKANSPS